MAMLVTLANAFRVLGQLNVHENALARSRYESCSRKTLSMMAVTQRVEEHTFSMYP
jgi:hypothetical protein